ncbi:MAG TPA: hypothetical protein V6C97_08840 [Oculatellaceae cyanobacterium]
MRMQIGGCRHPLIFTGTENTHVAINRKNSLFFGSDKGGEDAEVFMSLISSCRRHGVEPLTYLKDVIENSLPLLSAASMTFCRTPGVRQP